MNDKKFCFIMCTNNEHYEQEAIFWISKLHVPPGYEIDVISIKDAKSMTSGYNEGMRATDAKYKIYMHQDVMIIDQDMLYGLLKIFSIPVVGMIGMIGSPEMPEDQVMWHGYRIGMIYSSNITQMTLLNAGKVGKDCTEVEAVDGLFIATQYDLPWREDVFDKWDFYDVSQSYEFRKAGYKVVVPYMEKPWVIHDDGYLNLKNYDNERKKLLDEYCK